LAVSARSEITAKVRIVSAPMVGVGAVGREDVKYVAPFGLRWMELIEKDSANPLNLTGRALFGEEHSDAREWTLS
jgi:hypothetical protein